MPPAPGAKKTCLHRCRWLIAYVFGVLGMSAALIAVQQGCMHNRVNSFTTGYCLSENNMRAVVSALVTVMVWLVGLALSDAICSYRTAQLSHGISEGLYVALGSKDLKYCWKCLRTRWFLVVIAVLSLSYGPSWLQTVLSAVVTAVPVYVKTQSTATVFDHTSYYNATAPLSPQNFNNAVQVLSQLGGYNSGSNSVLNKDKTVTSSVLRSGFIGVTNIVDGDGSNAIYHKEVVMTATSSCSNPSNTSAPLSRLATPTSKTVYLYQSGVLEAYLYDLTFDVASQDHLRFYSQLTEAQCQSCYGSVSRLQVFAVQSSCTTDVFLSTQDIIYTLGNRSVTEVVSSNEATTVDTALFGQLVLNASISVEAAASTQEYAGAILNVFGSFPQGLFNVSLHNVAHSKICASLAISLDFLWSNYGTEYVDGQLINGNNFTQFDRAVLVYNMVIQAYMSTTASVLFAVGITVCVILLSGFAAFFSGRALINVKSVKENAFFSTVDKWGIDNMIADGGSNDEDKQCDLAFNRILYCSTAQVTVQNPNMNTTVERIIIGATQGHNAQQPRYGVQYH